MNCAGDRLTAICSGAAQEAASRQASRRIHSPISTIRPLSSASGMKSPGGHEAAHRMQPARQRLEADHLALGDRRARRCLRLVVQRQFAVPDREREVLMQHAAVADLLVHLRLVDADRAARFRLRAEQRRAGIGEQRGRIRAVVREHRDAGGDSRCEPPCRRYGIRWPSASATCSASAMPAAGCLPSMIKPNSSPERRATTPPRADACRRWATSISTLSPIAWPNTSLISFKPSRSTQSTANSSSVPAQASIICASACRNAARFGRSVRPS